MNNEQFLNKVHDVFTMSYEGDRQKSGKSSNKSTEKLKVMHGAIAKDLQERLDDLEPNKFQVIAKTEDSTGKGEESVPGRYFSKDIDITVKSGEQYIAAFELKFPAKDYSKNANNAFEGLLGNTANVRSGEADVMYFHIDVIQKLTPKLDKGKFKYDIIGRHQLEKYKKLSRDSTSQYFHTPQKSLLYLVALEGLDIEYQKKTRKIKETSTGKKSKSAYEIGETQRASISEFSKLKEESEMDESIDFSASKLIMNQKNTIDSMEKYGNAVEASEFNVVNDDLDEYQGGVIVNDYDSYMKKVIYSILSR